MKREELQGEAIFLVREVLSPAECAELIRHSEAEGYGEAPITMGESSILLKEFRSNDRVMVDDSALAEWLYQRLRPLLPERVDGWQLCGLNERLRFYRYDPGQTFASHYDGSYRRSEAEESRLTLLLYLNDDFAAGTTDFLHPNEEPYLQVRPEIGMALVFRHELLHAGTPVAVGRKYVLRSDVMYREARTSLG